MKTTLIAFKLVNEVVDESTGETWPVLKPHDHPVFTGDVAFDLLQEESILLCETLNVREFNSKGEAIQAINDYNREEANPVEMEDFFLLERICIHTPAKQKAKAKKISKSKNQ